MIATHPLMFDRAGLMASGWQRYSPEAAAALPFAEQVRHRAAGYSPTRMHDHLAGRLAAHQALARLGGDAAIVARAANGAPVWPKGYSGSISHVDALGFALVARGAANLGVDVENVARVGLLPPLSFAHPEELTILSSTAAAACLFSLKEAMFKALGYRQPRVFDPHAFSLTEINYLPKPGIVVRHCVPRGQRGICLNGIALVRGDIVCSVAWHEDGNRFLSPARFIKLIEPA